MTALLFKMEEANLASRAKAQELIQATNQVGTRGGGGVAPLLALPLAHTHTAPHHGGHPGGEYAALEGTVTPLKGQKPRGGHGHPPKRDLPPP